MKESTEDRQKGPMNAGSLRPAIRFAPDQPSGPLPDQSSGPLPGQPSVQTGPDFREPSSPMSPADNSDPRGPSSPVSSTGRPHGLGSSSATPQDNDLPPGDPTEEGKAITDFVRNIDGPESINKLLAGTYTRGWRTPETRNTPDPVSPGTLITDHPEAILQEGRVVHYFECPDCGFMIEVTTDRRPIEIRCASCNSRFRLKGKLSETAEEPAEPKPGGTDWDEKAKLADEAMKYHRLGDLNRAVEVYDRILRVSSNDPVVWNNKGVAHDGLGMHTLAVKCYEKAIQIRGNYVDAWFNLAYSLYLMKQFQKAVESLRTLLRLRPDHADGNRLLDKCEEELRGWKKYMD